MAVEAKKYYWLKLQKDFFKRHDVMIIENMPNGDKYIIFYLKLLTESITHDGELRFSDTIPYNENMLATITNTDIDTVRSAIKLFTELHLMEIWDDRTYFMTETQKMLGAETEWAKKKRKTRALQKDNVPKVSSPCPSNVRQEIEKELDIELEKDIDKELEKKSKEKNKTVNARFTPPTLQEVKSYCLKRKNNVDAERFVNFYASKGWMVGKNKMKDWKAAVRTWEKPNEEPKKIKVTAGYNLPEV